MSFTSPAFAAAGLTGAVALTRYVGGTASGAPVSGTFQLGDFVIDQTAAVWVCTVAGSPGTWSSTSGGSAVVATGRAQISGTSQYVIPGIQPANVGSKTLSSNRADYQPIMVTTPITINQIVLNVTGLVAASHVRMAIYNADVNWQPTTLVANTDTGAISTAATGIVATTITSTTLPAARYLVWTNSDSTNTILAATLGNSSGLLGYNPTNLQYFSQIFVAQTYGAPPGTGLQWTSTSGASTSNGFAWYSFLNVTAP